jgi:hypothetical protein
VTPELEGWWPKTEPEENSDGQWPVGYLVSKEKYADKKFLARMEIWKALQKWRELAEQYPDLKPKRFLMLTGGEREEVEDFQKQILSAAFYGNKDNKDFLEHLLEMVSLAESPEPDLHGVRAVHAAFEEFFTGGGLQDWPTKGQVTERAKEILKAAGQLVPQKRALTKILKIAGLSDLRENRPGRKPKAKK